MATYVHDLEKVLSNGKTKTYAGARTKINSIIIRPEARMATIVTRTYPDKDSEGSDNILSSTTTELAGDDYDAYFSEDVLKEGGKSTVTQAEKAIEEAAGSVLAAAAKE